jgi:CRISPR-associated endonuclease/helicase Cas3
MATVARAWLQQDTALQRRFRALLKCDQPSIEAWMLFFIALHDLWKFDARFQAKVPDAAAQLSRHRWLRNRMSAWILLF